MLKNKLKSHLFANKLTPIRVRLEKFLLDHSEGRLKNKSDHELLKMANNLIKGAINQIDYIFKGSDIG